MACFSPPIVMTRRTHPDCTKQTGRQESDLAIT